MTGYEQYATPRQLQYMKAIKAFNGDTQAASDSLGVKWETINRSLRSMRAVAARKGWAPEHDMTVTAPEGFRTKGTTTLYKQGVPLLQWVKTTADLDAQIALIKASAEAMCEDVPRLAPLASPGASLDHLLNVYTLTDSHVGMLAWHKEGGHDWDIEIAEQTLVGATERLILQSPRSKKAVIAQLGDFLHYDSAVNPVTPTHGHILDADGRMPQMVRASIRILRRVIDVALQHHEEVVVLLAEGNHDISSSVWLRAMFSVLYENEPRVEIIESELPYYAYQFGKTMLGWHHGHLKKNEHLPLLFAAQFPGIWGTTTKRYAHCGHRHHVEIKEHSGMTVTQHSTLAARDAHAARGGWFSERQIMGVTYHKEFGQTGTVVVTPEMLSPMG